MNFVNEMEMEEQNMAEVVMAFVREEVEDWDDEAKTRARFKALSGQRPDWEPLYRFWRDLIIKVARHLHIFVIFPSQVKRLWFQRAGLSPLCLDHVLIEMHRAGDLLAPYPTSSTSSLLQFFRRALDFLGPRNSGDDILAEDCYIIATLLEERALEVVKALSESYWTDSCVITMRKFEDICRGPKEAFAILGYLLSHGKAKKFILNGTNPIEGVKVCLASGAVSSVSSVDRTVLHLFWTTEKLERQLCLIDQQYEKSRNCALASLKSGNRSNALRYVKEKKLASQSRERYVALLDRVEKVLHVITDADSSKTVFEAIRSSTLAIQENMISVDEVEVCLQEVDENVDSFKQLDNALGSTAAHGEMDEEDVENEFNNMQQEIERDLNLVPEKTIPEAPAGAADVLDQNTLINALSNLNLKEDAHSAMPETSSCMLEAGIHEAA